jgi:hypothetical protein
MHKERRETEITSPSQKCLRCQGSAFFHIDIVDQVTAHRFHLYRCISCDTKQWTSPSDERALSWSSIDARLSA